MNSQTSYNYKKLALSSIEATEKNNEITFTDVRKTTGFKTKSTFSFVLHKKKKIINTSFYKKNDDIVL